MRYLSLLVLSTGLLVGCSSTRYGNSSPASARASSNGNGQTRYTICHKGRATRTLPESAVQAHLDHGDRFGECRGRRNNGNGRGRGNGRN